MPYAHGPGPAQGLNAGFEAAHMHSPRVEDHGHGASVGDLPIEASDLGLHQIHKGLTLCAHTTAAGKHCQSTAHTHST